MKYRNHRFAFGEAVSLLIASKHGLDVPKVYGYGEIYGASMLIEKSVLILENLANHIPIGDILRLNKDDQEKCVKCGTCLTSCPIQYNAIVKLSPPSEVPATKK